MPKQNTRQYKLVVVLALVLSFGLVGTAVAAQSSSTHYMVNETQFGAGSSTHDCSTNYCAKTSAGDTAVGSASSANYSAHFGANTSDVPLLEVIAEGGKQNVGVLDASTTTTSTNVIKVRNYLSNGYVLQLAGSPPVTGSHTLKALTTPTTSHPGAEQFGVNLVANTAPAIGGDPRQVPSGSYSFGTVSSDYSTPNLFKYVNGDVVARSSSSTGETDYTLSIIINVSNVTPGGNYASTFSAIAVPIY